MVKQKIESHKDIEELVKNWQGFSLYRSFMDEKGMCSAEGDGRTSLDIPWPSTGQIYRFLGEDHTKIGSHRYGLVNEKGQVTLTVRLDFRNENFKDGTDIKQIAERYVLLKRHLDESEVPYSPDLDFEQSIIEAGRSFSK